MAKNAIVAPTKTIIIAGKMGSEPEILINMYKDLIKQENPNAKVILKPNFGGSVFLFDALKSNKIDIYPEFTGTVLQILIKTNQKTGTNPYQGALLMKTSFAHDNPKIIAALNKLAGKITQKQMQEMHYLVVVKHEKASKVAYDYLVAHNLLKK